MKKHFCGAALVIAGYLLLILVTLLCPKTAIKAHAEEDTRDYLSFTAKYGDVMIGVEKHWDYFGSPQDLYWQYSFDKKSWTDVTLTGTADIVLIESEQTCYFRSKEKRTAISKDSGSWNFVMNPRGTYGVIQADGNVMSLLDPDCAKKRVGEYAFYGLFSGCRIMTSAPKLPAATLAESCYFNMFSECSRLETAPELPAQVMADYCYYGMFEGCSSLTEAPKLPATALAGNCYYGMFENCSRLERAPELPAAALADYCYSYMFSGCCSLEKAPKLPATALESDCYLYMFSDCSSLVEAPELPATTLTSFCYANMFEGCSRLTKAPELPATKMADYCYTGMFTDCSSLVKAPKLPAADLAYACYGEMFSGCSSLTEAPKLPAKNLTEDCYNEMFINCSSLKSVIAAFTNSAALGCLDEWLYGTAENGVLYCLPDFADAFITIDFKIPETWTLKPYIFSVTYFLNGGKNDAKNPSAYLAFENNISLASPTRKGYSFKGWYLDSDFRDKVTEVGSQNSGDITLYAKWQAKTYSLAFDPNKGIGTMDTIVGIAYDKSKVLPTNTFTLRGYQFAGWNTKADGTGIAYADGVSVKNLSASSGAVVTFYAQWKPNTYSIKFNGNGAASGSVETVNNCVYGTQFTLPANAFKLSGYQFAGWNTKADGTGTGYANKSSVKNVTSINGKTVILYAQWKPTEYKITYGLNGGQNAAANPSVYTKFSDVILLASPTRTGYTFKGWYKEETFTTKVTKINTGSTGNKTFYAKWTPNQYTIAFDGNGAASGEMADLPGREYDRTYTLRTNAFQKTGYTFAGWNTKADGSGTFYEKKASVTNLSAENGAVVTLYALWAPNTYTVAFDGNGATSGEMNPLTKRECGKTYTLRTNAFVKAGYTFKNWNTKADGSGTAYKNKAEFLNLSMVNGDTVTLYAQWRVIDYTITYQLYGGTNAAASPDTYRITTGTITLAAPTRTGYRFVRWYNDADPITKISKGSTGDLVLTANWEPIQYNISFNGNGAVSGKMSDWTGLWYNGVYTMQNCAFKRTGYEFAGWNTERNGSGYTYEAGEIFRQGLTAEDGATVVLYAQWEKK